MGKRNRIKSKRAKGAISSLEIMTRLLPSSREILESKEKFVEELKLLYSKCIKDFYDAIEMRKKNCLHKPLKHMSSLGLFNYQKFEVHDISNEFNHIFSIQAHRFLTLVLNHTRDVCESYPSLIKYCIKDSYNILELASKETQKITSFFPNEPESNYQHTSHILFQEIIMKNKIIEDYCKHLSIVLNIHKNCEKQDELSPVKHPDAQDTLLFENRILLSNKKKNKKKRRKEDLYDEIDIEKEIEDFKSKLEIENLNNFKIKPNFSQEWIANLRKRLQDRAIKSY